MDLKSLLSEICSTQLRFERLNDAKVDSGTYHVIIKDVTDDFTKTVEPKFFLTNGEREYGVTIKQLAALRIANDVITARWLHEFESDKNATNLQAIARKLAEKGIGLDTLRLVVTQQLQVRNEFCSTPNTPVYIDKCYTGINDYKTSVRKLIDGKPGKYWETKEYQFGVRDAREKNHATALKPEMVTDANVVMLPVFKVVQ